MLEILCKQSIESILKEESHYTSHRRQLRSNAQNAFQFALRAPEGFFVLVFLYFSRQ